MNRKYFGTDGIRGPANQGIMTPDRILRIGQAFGVFLKRRYTHPKVLIGKDTRVSGYMIENVLSAGLCSVGVNVLFVGPLPTPGVAYLTRGLRAEAGIMISASHNPYTDNGLKFFAQDGFKLPDSDEEALETLTDDRDLTKHLVSSDTLGRARRIDDAIGQYSVFLKERFPKHLTLDGKRIVLDCAHGAGYRIGPKVLVELGAEVIPLHCEPDGFNINRESGALSPDKLCQAVLHYRADIGLALDGDADRLVVVDEKGEILGGDHLIALCALDMLDRQQLENRGVCVTVMSNMGLEFGLQNRGVHVERTPVGDRAVMECLRQKGYTFGGEASGHLIFLDATTTGDAMIAALKVLEVLCTTGQKASDYQTIISTFPQITKNVRVSHFYPLEELKDLQEAKTKFEEELGATGRILVRYSGTEPVLRITLEGPNQTRLAQMAETLVHAVAEPQGKVLSRA